MLKRIETTARAFGRRAALWAALTLGAGGAAQADTLAEAFVGAYRTAGLIEQNRAVLRAADEDVAQAVAELRPVFNWSAAIRREFGTTASQTTRGEPVGNISESANLSLTAELTLYDFGANRLGVDAAKEAVLAARATLVSVEQQVFLRAAQAFFELQRARQTVSLRQNNLQLISRELRAARDRFEVGEVTRTDVALAEARLAEARSQLALAQGNEAIAVAEYIAATGREPGVLNPPSTLPTLPTSDADAVAIALRSQPAILAQQRQVAVAELNVLIAEASTKPTVTLQGQLSANRNLNDSDLYSRSGSISLGAQGPIYRGGRLSSLVRQAIAQRDQQRAILLRTVEERRQAVANAFVNLRVSRAAIESGQNQVRAAQVAFDGIREEALLGARTTLDVLDAEQDLLDARTLLISSNADLYTAAYQALSALGRLTVTALGLPVQQYDPTEYYNLVKDAPNTTRESEKLDRVLRALGKQ